MDTNPYQPPSVSQQQPMNRDDRLLRQMIQKLTEWRLGPPTVVGLVFSLRSLPMLAIVGTAIVLMLVSLEMPREFWLVVAGVFLGAALRDIGWIRRAVRSWKIQEELMDWGKIEALARELKI